MSDLFFNENVTIHMGHVPMGCTIGHALMGLGYVPGNFLYTYPKTLVHVLMTGGIATYTKCTCVGLVHVSIEL